MLVQCSECGKVMKASAEMLDDMGECTCGETFVITEELLAAG